MFWEDEAKPKAHSLSGSSLAAASLKCKGREAFLCVLGAVLSHQPILTNVGHTLILLALGCFFVLFFGVLFGKPEEIFYHWCPYPKRVLCTFTADMKRDI
ncbi:UNVERIFIED_CONTAM: hypothetical protein K2H54_020424 [Gekko kuhli]